MKNTIYLATIALAVLFTTACKKDKNDSATNNSTEDLSDFAINFNSEDSVFFIETDSLVTDYDISITSSDQVFNPQFSELEQTISISFNSPSTPIIAVGFSFNNNDVISFIPITPTYQTDSLELQYTLSNLCKNLSDCTMLSRKLYALNADSAISSPHETSMTLICGTCSGDLCENICCTNDSIKVIYQELTIDNEPVAFNSCNSIIGHKSNKNYYGLDVNSVNSSSLFFGSYDINQDEDNQNHIPIFHRGQHIVPDSDNNFPVDGIINHISYTEVNENTLESRNFLSSEYRLNTPEQGYFIIEDIITSGDEVKYIVVSFNNIILSDRGTKDVVLNGNIILLNP